jgi:hypothetical protein
VQNSKNTNSYDLADNMAHQLSLDFDKNEADSKNQHKIWLDNDVSNIHSRDEFSITTATATL